MLYSLQQHVVAQISRVQPGLGGGEVLYFALPGMSLMMSFMYFLCRFFQSVVFCESKNKNPITGLARA